MKYRISRIWLSGEYLRGEAGTIVAIYREDGSERPKEDWPDALAEAEVDP